MTELDNSDLAKVSELAQEGNGRYTGTAGLTTMAKRSGIQPWLTRTKARYELVMQAGRDAELAEPLGQLAYRFEQLTREAVAQPHTVANKRLERRQEPIWRRVLIT